MVAIFAYERDWGIIISPMVRPAITSLIIHRCRRAEGLARAQTIACGKYETGTARDRSSSPAGLLSFSIVPGCISATIQLLETCRGRKTWPSSGRRADLAIQDDRRDSRCSPFGHPLLLDGRGWALWTEPVPCATGLGAHR